MSDEYKHLQVRTAIGRFAGVDKGEWGGALVWLPDSEDAQRLMRLATSAIFEQGPHTYFVTDQAYMQAKLYRLDPPGPDGRWTIRFLYRHPGSHVHARRVGSDVVLYADEGKLTLSESGEISVSP